MSQTRTVAISEAGNRVCRNGVLEVESLLGSPFVGRLQLDDGDILNLIQTQSLPAGSLGLLDLDGDHVTLCGRTRFIPDRVLDITLARPLPRPEREQDLLQLLLFLLLQVFGEQISRSQLTSLGLSNVAALELPDLVFVANRAGINPRRVDFTDVWERRMGRRISNADLARVNQLATQVQRQQQRQSQRQFGAGRQSQFQQQAEAQAQSQIGAGRQSQFQQQAEAQAQSQIGSGFQSQSESQFQAQMQAIRQALRSGGLIV